MNYLLDTNALVALMEARQPLYGRMRQRPAHEFGLPSIVAHELYYGAYHGQRTNETLARFSRLTFEIVPFDDEDAKVSAEIRARLRAIGTPIGPYDVLIAGQALARGLILITRNTGEFSRVDGLVVENWENA